MSIQISTRIDETTKQQFDKVCESIGISASNALSMFIKSVINYNGIPFEAVAPREKTVPLPFGRGRMKGKMRISDDFDEPLDDFKEYME
jgi:addiction module RelB/DinJ family antitoxin